MLIGPADGVSEFRAFALLGARESILNGVFIVFKAY
jgi:hypothetical protein